LLVHLALILRQNKQFNQSFTFQNLFKINFIFKEKCEFLKL